MRHVYMQTWFRFEEHQLKISGLKEEKIHTVHTVLHTVKQYSSYVVTDYKNTDYSCFNMSLSLRKN